MMARAARARRREDALPDIRAVLRSRTDALLDRLFQEAADDVIASALAAPTDAGGLARLLSETAPLGAMSARIDPFADAIARGAEAKQELLRDAGGGWSSTQVAKHLGISRQAVDKRRRANKLLALQSGRGDYVYPTCQFTDDGVIAGIDRYLGAFPPSSGWPKLDVLLAPAEEIGNVTPLDALKRGNVDDAVHVASGFGTQGGAYDAEP
jgi:hypothetical protein